MDQTTQKDAAEKAAPAEAGAAGARATEPAAPRSRFRQLEPATEGDRIRIEARGDGAYRLAGFDGGPSVDLRFQEGEAAEVGTNGVTPAQLIAVAVDRLRQQQEAQAKQAADAGDRAPADKASSAAIRHLEAALGSLSEGARQGQDRAQARAEDGARASAQAPARAAAAAAPTSSAQPAAARAAAQAHAQAPAQAPKR
jgi:hypothetical protein